MVDDFTSPCDIVNFFASKYQDLYTSAKFDKAEMDVVRGDIESSVLDRGFINDCIVIFTAVYLYHRNNPTSRHNFPHLLRMTANLLSLKPSKTEFMLIGLPQQISKISNTSLFFPSNHHIIPTYSAAT